MWPVDKQDIREARAYLMVLGVFLVALMGMMAMCGFWLALLLPLH